uniref:Ribonuclease H protein At1g65750 family n=1 Tax=Cajanus cajan TaxID=3821 RepID=A0A151SCJ2_CAJCA|nr:Putative ribonuclease H protein At1g65750 family [Cajanus cajan]
MLWDCPAVINIWRKLSLDRRIVSWIYPPEHVFKLNVDGSSIGNPRLAGYGGLLHNSVGEWIRGFTGSCVLATSLYAELLALLKGIQLAWDMNICDFLCESDSLPALQLITQDTSFYPYATVINKI